MKGEIFFCNYKLSFDKFKIGRKTEQIETVTLNGPVVFYPSGQIYDCKNFIEQELYKKELFTKKQFKENKVGNFKINITGKIKSLGNTMYEIQ